MAVRILLFVLLVAMINIYTSRAPVFITYDVLLYMRLSYTSICLTSEREREREREKRVAYFKPLKKGYLRRGMKNGKN